MRIQNNISAMNAHRVLGSNNAGTAKSLEKLSSGFKINRAGDDAAGLAISEKMRAQIKGLETAQANANDGISLVQTAEGALTEVHSMLNRMTELATKSANGTIQDEVDREAIQKEVNALNEEIDRIAKGTNFNGIKLLDGSIAGGSTSVESGAKIATVKGDMGAVLKTGVTDAAAAKGKYDADLGALITATVDKGATFGVTIDYVDTNGASKSKTLTITASDTHANTTAGDTALIGDIKTAINADEELSKLFAATNATSHLSLEANTAGTGGAKFSGIKVGTASAGTITSKDVDSTTLTLATDKTTKDIIDFTSASLTAGKKITVGSKTYELVAANGDTSAVGKGNIAVNLGVDDNATVVNLVKSLNANGVKSASGTTKADGIKITDLSEISAAEVSQKIATTSNGVTIGSQNAVKAKSEFSVGSAAVDAVAKNLTITYVDESGVEKTTKLAYTADTTQADSVTNIAAAINSDKELSKIFAATGGTGKVSLEAKTEGSAGAKLVSIATDDNNGTSAVGKAVVVAEGTEAGKTVSLDASKITAGQTLSVNGKTFEFTTADRLSDVKNGNVAVLIDSNSSENTSANLNLALKNSGVEYKYNPATSSFLFEDGKASATTGGLSLQVGETSDTFQKVGVSVADMSASGLGIKGLDVSTADSASKALDQVKTAINTVSNNRAGLGAVQNRLEHTINNLGVAQENITAAESRIRDVDMAKEMMNFTKNNILTQAAQAMLAQANQQPQGVLQLLR